MLEPDLHHLTGLDQVSWPNVNPNNPLDVGYYSPDRTEAKGYPPNGWEGVVMPGRRIAVELGYGSDLVRVFTGEIDDVEITSDPGDYSIAIDCRDFGAWLLDQDVKNGDGQYFITYKNMDLSDIVRDVLTRAGFASQDITTEPSGISVTEKTFSKQRWADVIEWAASVTGFELIITEDGKAIWQYPRERQPEVRNEAVTLTGTDWVALANDTLVVNSEVVTDQTGQTVYTPGADYLMDYETGQIARTANSAIPDGATVLVDYVYAAWTFREGEDIFRLPYRISRRDLYGQIRVVGAEKPEGGNYAGYYIFPNAAAFGVPADKILWSEQPELGSDADCQAAANQMGNDMSKQARSVEFAAVGNPWIQVGDCIKVVESNSTISQIYRITGLTHEFSPDGFVTTIRAYYYGATPV